MGIFQKILKILLACYSNALKHKVHFLYVSQLFVNVLIQANLLLLFRNLILNTFLQIQSILWASLNKITN